MGYIRDDSDKPLLREKEQLVRAMLAYVPKHGWNIKSLQAAALDCSIADAELIFPSARPYDFVCAAHDLAEHQLMKDLQQLQQQDGWAELPIRQKIAKGVRQRLEPWNDERRSLRRAIPIILQPQYFFHSTRCLYETLDKIWRAAGDLSVDHNFYTKRIILATVYLPTIFFWLNDNSSDCHNTWGFLEKRIEKALKLGRRMGKPLGSAKSPLASLRLMASMLKATFIKGSMSAKP